MDNYNLGVLFQKIGTDNKEIFELAKKTKFIQRSRLVTAQELLFALCSESIYGTVSYNDIASQIELTGNISVSRQAIWKKVTEPCLEFFQGILEMIILKKMDENELKSMKKNCSYKRILVQDSTIIKLPVSLFSCCSGVANQSTQVCNARIQGVYDILNERFITFSIDPYSKNDLKPAPELELEEGDLTLRDRGYLIYDEVQRHIDNQADCIYRFKHGMSLLEPETEAPIDLLGLLKKKNFIDMNVKLNNKDKTVVRLSAVPVDQKTASARRMKAKQEKKALLQSNTYNFSHGQSLLPLYQ